MKINVETIENWCYRTEFDDIFRIYLYIQSRGHFLLNNIVMVWNKVKRKKILAKSKEDKGFRMKMPIVRPKPHRKSMELISN